MEDDEEMKFVPFCSRIFFPYEKISIYTSPEDLHDEEFIMLSNNIYEAESTEYCVYFSGNNCQNNSFYEKKLIKERYF